MRIEDLRLEVRPRKGLEAVDMGVRMVQTWPRQLFVPTLILSLALAALVSLFNPSPYWALFWLWLFKPLVSFVPLFVLSRAAFGAVPQPLTTLKNCWPFARTHALAELSYRRLHPFRALLLPVRTLEGLHGSDRKKRLRFFQNYHSGDALLMTCVYMLIEWIVLPAGIYGFISLLLTSVGQEALLESPEPYLFTLTVLLLYSCIIALVEPFYIAGGFALYLNSRTIAEGWDLELVFRRLAKQFTKYSLSLLFLLGTLGAFTPLHAQNEQPRLKDPKLVEQQLEKILQDPIFPHVEKKRIRTFPTLNEVPQQAPSSSPLWGLLGDLIRVLLLTALLFFLLWLLFLFFFNKIRRKKTAHSRLLQEPLELPSILRGDHPDQGFPADIAQQAQFWMAEGRPREALSLLYRGALWKLSQHRDLRIPPFATEEECLQLVQSRFPGEFAEFFKELTRSWQYTAYGHQHPDMEQFTATVKTWNRFLRALV